MCETQTVRHLTLLFLAGVRVVACGALSVGAESCLLQEDELHCEGGCCSHEKCGSLFCPQTPLRRSRHLHMPFLSWFACLDYGSRAVKVFSLP